MGRKGYFETKSNRRIGGRRGQTTRGLNQLGGFFLLIFLVVALIQGCIEKIFS